MEISVLANFIQTLTTKYLHLAGCPTSRPTTLLVLTECITNNYFNRFLFLVSFQFLHVQVIPIMKYALLVNPRVKTRMIRT